MSEKEQIICIFNKKVVILRRFFKVYLKITY